MAKITLINQVTGPLFIDIANAYHRGGFETALYTGDIEKASTTLDNEIKVIRGKGYNRKNAILRIFSWLTFTVLAFFRLLFADKKRPLFFVSNPPMGPFLGLFFKKVFGQLYYVLIYDIYPDVLVEMSYCKRDSVIVKIWSYLNKRLFHNAEKVFTISEGMKNRLLSYDTNIDCQVIYNWVDTSYIKPLPKENNFFVKEHNLIDKTVVLYSGNLGLTHDIEGIVEAAQILEKETAIHFLIIGSGAKKEIIEKQIVDNNIDNVTILPFQSSETIPYSMTSGDIAIVTLANGVGDLSVPSKTYYMMSAGLAIIAIAEPDSEIATLVDTHMIGVSVAPGKPQELADKILEITAKKNELNLYKSRSIETAHLFTPANAEEFVKATNCE